MAPAEAPGRPPVPDELVALILRAPDDAPNVTAFPGPATRIQRRTRLAGLINEYRQAA